MHTPLLLTASAVSEALLLLPGWVGLGAPLLCFFLGIVVPYCVLSSANRLALGSQSRFETLAWPEQARLAYCARRASIFSTIGALSLVSMVATIHSGPFVLGGWVVVSLSAALGLGVAAVVTRVRLETRLRGNTVSVLEWLRSLVIVLVLFLFDQMMILALALVGPSHLDLRTLIVCVLCLGAIVLSLKDGGLLLLRLVGFARPADLRLTRVANAAAVRVGIRPAAVWELRWSMANAVAFPITRQIAVTEAALASLDDGEIESLCVHELAHLREPGRVKALRAVKGFIFLPLVGVRPFLEAYGAIAVVIGLAIIVWLMGLHQWALRRWEVSADAAATTTPEEGRVYASALEKCYRINLVPAVVGTQNLSHPELYDRLVVAGMPLPGDRPKAPSALRTYSAIAVSCLLGVVLFACFEVVLIMVLKPAMTEWQAQASIATEGGSPRSLADFGDLRFKSGDRGTARVFYRAIEESAPDSEVGPALMARLLAEEDDCEGAERKATASEQINGAGVESHPGELVVSARRATVACWKRKASSSPNGSLP